MLGFGVEHPGPGAARALAFLAADFFNLGAVRGDETFLPFFNFVEQQAARDETVESLLARFLTFDLHAGRTMNQHYAGGNFVHVLSTVPAGTDKTFLDVRLAHAQRVHPLRELAGFFEADGECAHGKFIAAPALASLAPSRRREAILRKRF
jgi:hypothetical protein